MCPLTSCLLAVKNVFTCFFLGLKLGQVQITSVEMGQAPARMSPQVEDSPDEALSVVEFQPNKTGLVRILRRGSHKQDKIITKLHISKVSLTTGGVCYNQPMK